MSGGTDDETFHMVANDGGGQPRRESDGATTERELVNELFETHLGLVDVIAKSISRAIDGVVEFDELLAAGREGLFDAARRYDPSRGLPFRAFASFRVEGAIVDGVRKSFRLPRRLYEQLGAFESTREQSVGASGIMRHAGSYPQRPPPEQELSEHLAAMATAAAVARGRSIRAEDAADERQLSNPEVALATAELLALVKDAVSELDPYQAEVISFYYFEGKSFEAAAEAMQISKPWASRLHARGIELLTKRLRGMNSG